MQVTVKLFAGFRTGRFDVAQLDHPDGITAGAVVDALRIPRDEIGVLMIGGRHAALEQQLSPGETLAVFPLVGGG